MPILSGAHTNSSSSNSNNGLSIPRIDPNSTAMEISKPSLPQNGKPAKKRKVQCEPGTWKCERCKGLNIPELKYCSNCLCKIPAVPLPSDNDVEMTI